MTSVAKRRRLSFAIFKNLRVEFPLKYCRASLVKLKIFEGGKATILLITLYNPETYEEISCSQMDLSLGTSSSGVDACSA